MNLLLVSDLHLGYDQIEQMVKREIEAKTKIDYVLASGDFNKINHDDPNLAEAEEKKGEEELTRILEMLEVFKAPIFYIPGNHDPKSLFSSKPALSAGSFNLH